MDITKLDLTKKHVIIVPSYYRSVKVYINDINGNPSSVSYIDFLMHAIGKFKTNGSVLAIPESNDVPIRVYEMGYDDNLDVLHVMDDEYRRRFKESIEKIEDKDVRTHLMNLYMLWQ